MPFFGFFKKSTWKRSDYFSWINRGCPIDNHVKTLDLYAEDIEILPYFIENLVNLEYLYLSENNLTSIPSSIGKLKKLKELWINGNKLTTLPDEIVKLRNLKSLLYSSNNFKKLSPVVITFLRWFYDDFCLYYVNDDDIPFHRSTSDREFEDREFEDTPLENILKVKNITTKEEWKCWIRKNHPDKGGDTQIFIEVLKAGRIEFE